MLLLLMNRSGNSPNPPPACRARVGRIHRTLHPTAPRGDLPRAGTSVRKRPQPELFLADLPKPRKSMRLDDQEENDQTPEYHQLEIGNRTLGDVQIEVA